jgi:hypothetical protein
MNLMAMFPEKENADERVTDMFGPIHVDQQIRQAIQFCWMGLPKERRTVAEVKAQISRMVERAFRDFQEDAQAFGVDK